MTRIEILEALMSIPDGKSDVINDRCVMSEHGGFYVEGHKKLLSRSVAADKISRKPRKAAA